MNPASSLKFTFASLFVLSALTLPAHPGNAAEAVEPNLNGEERALVEWLDSREGDMVSLLRRLTNINSGSLNKAGVDAMTEIFRAELIALGFSTRTLPGERIEMPSCPGSDYAIDVADHLLASKDGSGTRLLLMGHLDTVFPTTSPFQSFRQQGDTLYGPGVADMKGGLVVMLYALRALAASGDLDDMAITVLLNSDEEVGSLSSRPFLEQQAQLHDYGLVYESSGTNNLVRTRKGLGQARFVVHGKAAHAGGAHEQGRSAIKELAYKIVEIENMTNYETGVTVIRRYPHRNQLLLIPGRAVYRLHESCSAGSPIPRWEFSAGDAGLPSCLC